MEDRKTKITKYLSKKNGTVRDNRKRFDEIVVVHLGVERNREYYPNAVDENGKKIIGSDGNVVKSNVKHYMNTFSELGTSKMVKVVTARKVDFDGIQGSYFEVNGRGYDISSSNLIFIDTEAKLNGI